ncbi:MAG: response regulator, partial [Chitinophagaceae bacterium]
MPNKVLICDDDREILTMLNLVLRSEDLEIMVEPESILLIDRLLAFKPDILLIDIWMPGLSGDQVVKKIRQMPVFDNLKIYMMSASHDGDVIAR